jgi:hypothetical protein
VRSFPEAEEPREHERRERAANTSGEQERERGGCSERGAAAALAATAALCLVLLGGTCTACITTALGCGLSLRNVKVAATVGRTVRAALAFAVVGGAARTAVAAGHLCHLHHRSSWITAAVACVAVGGASAATALAATSSTAVAASAATASVTTATAAAAAGAGPGVTATHWAVAATWAASLVVCWWWCYSNFRPNDLHIDLTETEEEAAKRKGCKVFIKTALESSGVLTLKLECSDTVADLKVGLCVALNDAHWSALYV